MKKSSNDVSGKTGNNASQDEQIVVETGFLVFRYLIFDILDAINPPYNSISNDTIAVYSLNAASTNQSHIDFAFFDNLS